MKILLQYLREIFQLTECTPKELIGMKIKRDHVSGELKVSQQHYIDKIIAKFGMSNANSISVSLDSGEKLLKSNAYEHELNNHLPYREALGSLLFFSQVCRPDIEYADNYLSQFFN